MSTPDLDAIRQLAHHLSILSPAEHTGPWANMIHLASDTVARIVEALALVDQLRTERDDLRGRLGILAEVERAPGLSDFHAAGLLEITDADLEAIMGAIATRRIMSAMDAAALVIEIQKQRARLASLEPLIEAARQVAALNDSDEDEWADALGALCAAVAALPVPPTRQDES